MSTQSCVRGGCRVEAEAPRAGGSQLSCLVRHSVLQDQNPWLFLSP